MRLRLLRLFENFSKKTEWTLVLMKVGEKVDLMGLRKVVTMAVMKVVRMAKIYL